MPASTTGLGAQLGLGVESSYATEAAANRFYEFSQEGMSLSRAFIMSAQLRAGRLFQSSTRRTATTRSASGTVQFEVPNQLLSNWLNLMHGETITGGSFTQEGVSGIYKVLHNIGTTDPYQKSVTAQVGTPETTGTVDAYTYPGTVCTALEFALQTGGLLEATATLDSQDEITSTALATATYPTGLESFNHTQAKVKVGGVEVTEARGFTFTINGPRDTSRFYLGATKKKVPLTNAYNGAAASLTCDYGGKTLYESFAKGEIKSLEIIIEGAVVSTSKYEIKIVCAACGLDGGSPDVQGPGIVGQTVPLVVLDNGATPPVVVTVLSKDKEL